MASQLCMSMSRLAVAAPARPAAPRAFGGSLAGTRLTATQRSAASPCRRGLVVLAAQNSDKRIRTSERNRQYNKPRKSAVATRVKKVLKALEGLKEIKEESELAPVQVLLNEAYEEIDKAVVKGVLHKNTGARRKSRMARARQRVLIANGLYTPASA